MNTHLHDQTTHASSRMRLCNIETAGAVATQITETTGRTTVIIDTTTTIQPYRVEFMDNIGPNDKILAEIHMAA